MYLEKKNVRAGVLERETLEIRKKVHFTSVQRRDEDPAANGRESPVLSDEINEQLELEETNDDDDDDDNDALGWWSSREEGRKRPRWCRS